MIATAPRLFVGAVLIVCYAVEPIFTGLGINPLPMQETRPERLIKWAVLPSIA